MALGYKTGANVQCGWKGKEVCVKKEYQLGSCHSSLGEKGGGLKLKGSEVGMQTELFSLAWPLPEIS